MKHALTDRITLALFAMGVLLLTMAASCTAADAAAASGAVAAVGASAAALLDVVAPLMSPEQFAEFRQGVEGIDGTVQATKSVLGSIVDAFGHFREAVDTKMQTVGTTLQQTQVDIASKATTQEVLGYTVGGASVSTGASRALSMLKHNVAPKPKLPVG